MALIRGGLQIQAACDAPHTSMSLLNFSLNAKAQSSISIPSAPPVNIGMWCGTKGTGRRIAIRRWGAIGVDGKTLQSANINTNLPQTKTAHIAVSRFNTGGVGGGRTLDQRIKSPLRYRCAILP